MGIFCNNITSSFLHLPEPTGKAIGNPFELVKEKKSLFYSEALALNAFCSQPLFGKGLFALHTLVMERDLEIIISNREKLYNGEEWSDPFYPPEGKPIVLGEYCKGNGKNTINLYIQNIRIASRYFKGARIDDIWDLSCEGEYGVGAEDLLLEVLAHELYHAYFQKGNYEKEAEEPLAEFGSLLYLNRYFEETAKELRGKKILGLHRMVRQKSGEIEVYSRGAKLFLLSDDLENKDDVLNLIDDYKNAADSDLPRFSDRIKSYVYQTHSFYSNAAPSL